MPGTNRLRALLALLAAVAALSGCGSDEIGGEIPATNAAELNAALDGVNAAIASQDCETAAQRATDFVDEVNLLPLDAGKELKDELRAAGEHLGTLVAAECPATGTSGTTQDTTTTTPTDTTDTIPTETTTTDTTTTDTTTTDTTTTGQTQPPGDGNGGGPPNGGTGGTGGGGPGDEGGD